MEVLVEMGANSLERQGRVNKYTPLALLELLKYAPAFARALVILWLQGRETTLPHAQLGGPSS